MVVNPVTLPPEVALQYGQKILATPVPYLVHNIAAEPMRMEARGGNTLVRRRYNPFPTATVPLGNLGDTPPPINVAFVDVSLPMQFYGQYTRIEEQTTLTNQDNVLNNLAKRFGVALRQTEDELTRNMLQSTASQINCTNGVNGDNPTELSRADIDLVIRTLASNNAYTISDMIEGEDRFGTAPVRDAYFAMANTALIGNLESVNGFIAKAQYPAQMNVLRPEWGSVSNLRFLLSSIGAVEENASAAGSDIYDIFVTGMEAYQVVEQDGYSTQFIYRPPMYNDPLAQNATLGWKMAYAAGITNDAWVLNLRTTLA